MYFGPISSVQYPKSGALGEHARQGKAARKGELNELLKQQQLALAGGRPRLAIGNGQLALGNGQFALGNGQLAIANGGQGSRGRQPAQQQQPLALQDRNDWGWD